MKTIFAREKEQKDKEQSTEDSPADSITEHVVDVIPEPPGEPPPLPDLPAPPSPNDVLRVTDVGSEGKKTVKNQYGKTKVQWTPFKMLKPRKILEICTWTMMITTVALEKSGMWKACTPVSIEHGYDILTASGRKHAEDCIYSEEPDMIVGEWMCGPFSSMQNTNLGKSWLFFLALAAFGTIGTM